jgi:pimeloyl-ACP methyl ester carboxylesterase
MISLRMVGTEVSALGAAALSMPLRFVLEQECFDPGSPHPTPVVLVHGFLGDPTNFLLLRRYLATRGIRNFTAFSYGPRLDYQRLACRLGRLIETICLATGAADVDVVGHSLGGLVARYLVEISAGSRVRRLVTLGAPYFANPLPAQERAIFAASDPFIPPPHPVYGPQGAHRRGQVVVVPECGHWGLLYHPTVLRETAGFLGSSAEALELSPAPLALEAAS